jgi:hypothetical protein
MKAKVGWASTTTLRCALPRIVFSPQSAVFFALRTSAPHSRNLPYPKASDPEDQRVRYERHVPARSQLAAKH